MVLGWETTEGQWNVESSQTRYTTKVVVKGACLLTFQPGAGMYGDIAYLTSSVGINQVYSSAVS